MKNSAGARLSVADLQSPQNGAQKVKQMPIIEAEFEATSPAGEFYVLKSNNLQYNTLGHWIDGTNNSSTNRLMFQVLFSFIISCKILCKNCFNLFFYSFIDLQK